MTVYPRDGPTELDADQEYAHNAYMRIAWEPAKAKVNFLKHGVRFSDAEGVLYDPMALTCEDERSLEERRFISIGMDYLTRVVVVVFAPRGDTARLISARRASKKERHQYAKRVRF